MARHKVRWWKRRSLKLLRLKLIIVLLTLSLLNSHFNLMKKFRELPGIQRFGWLVFCDGITYRIKKYWFQG